MLTNCTLLFSCISFACAIQSSFFSRPVTSLSISVEPFPILLSGNNQKILRFRTSETYIRTSIATVRSCKVIAESVALVAAFIASAYFTSNSTCERLSGSAMLSAFSIATLARRFSLGVVQPAQSSAIKQSENKTTAMMRDVIFVQISLCNNSDNLLITERLRHSQSQ